MHPCHPSREVSLRIRARTSENRRLPGNDPKTAISVLICSQFETADGLPKNFIVLLLTNSWFYWREIPGYRWDIAAHKQRRWQTNLSRAGSKRSS
jgi:hypothetical protein